MCLVRRGPPHKVFQEDVACDVILEDVRNLAAILADNVLQLLYLLRVFGYGLRKFLAKLCRVNL